MFLSVLLVPLVGALLLHVWPIPVALAFAFAGGSAVAALPALAPVRVTPGAGANVFLAPLVLRPRGFAKGMDSHVAWTS